MAMVRFRGLTALLAWAQLVTVHGADCLSTVDVIPANQRVDISLNGQSMPIGFSGPDWDSARLYSKIAEIITKEILGFNTQMGPHGDESGTSYKLAAEGNSIHFLSEIWSSFSEDIVVFDAANPELALPSLKNLDYSGRDGIFIFPKSFQPYYDTYGKSLEFYQYFNVSVLRRTSDFSKIADFDLTQLSACDDSEGGAEIEKTYYLQTTGDTDAVVNGAWVCHQGKWWLSPGCRSDPTSCVPLLTHLFWGWSEMRQKAAYFNMPIAMASTASNEIYKQWPKDNKMLAYWWMPDDRFTADGAIQMFFPDHNPGLWEVGNKVTMAVAEPLYSYYKPGIDSAAPKVYLLMSSMTLFDDDMIRLLNDVVAARAQGITAAVEHVACSWVQNNGPRWRKWIPIATECTRSLGFGMVADDGTFVQDRSLATGCSLCTPGRFASAYSDLVGQSAVCVECPNGTAQDRGGQTECVECAAGTYRVPSGIRCSPCGKGTYQPQGAQDSCLSCSSPMTTVTVGSDTQDMCICPEKTYRPCYDVDNNGAIRSECQCDTGFYTQGGGRCVGCPDGMVCEEGSDEQFFPCAEVDIVNSTVNPYPKPDEGYFVLLQQPTYVFKCIDLLSCPGGQAENCGTGLRGIACGACDAGYYKQAGACNQCGEFEQSPMFLIIPALISPAFVFVLYKVSLADVHLWGRTGQGFGGIGYLLLVYVQTVSVIISVFPTLPSTLVGGIGWTSTSAEITSLFRLECAGPSDFVGSFILNLVLPEIAGIVFFVTWLGAMLISRFVPKLRMDGDVVLGCFGGILKTFFVTVASKCFSLFQCYNHPNKRLSMRASPEVLQGSDEWSSMVIFAAMAILVNCVLLLVVISWAMWVAPQRFHLKSFRMRWKFMIQKMRPSVYWWMMTIFFKGLWISLTGVLFTNAMQQSLWVCFGLLFYTTISYVFLPWRSVFVTILDIGTHVSTLLLCLLLPFLIDFEEDEQQTAVGIFVALAVCGFLSVVGAITWACIKGFSPWWKRRRERNIEYYAQRMAEVFSSVTEPRLLAEMMTEIPALDILEIKYVATMMSAEILGKHVIGRLNWGEPALTKPVEDKFVDGVARSQVIWT